jgi:8-oxo-dGTP pyrophosphatase MutT (NUDIX family)
MWEFSGGKLNPRESLTEGLRRELWEELRIDAEPAGDVLLDVPDPDSDYVIKFIPVTIHGTLHMREHEEIRWATPKELVALALAPADRRFAELVLSLHQEA